MKTVLKSGGSLLILAGFLGALHTAPAAAQDAASIQSIQRQIQSLQAQLKKVQAESAARDAQLQAAQADAAAAKAQAAAAQAATSTAATAPSAAPFATPDAFVKRGKCDGKYAANDPNKVSPTFCLGNVSITLGGFIDVTGLYRSRDENAGLSSSFAGIPFPQSPNNHTGEFRGTAQATRFSTLLEANPYDGATLDAYAELDLNSAGSSSNSTTTNSYTMRVRQAYVQFDDSNMNLHVLGGQAWSLLTPFSSGLTPRKELIPQVIDANYTPGFFYARQPQIRVSTNIGSLLYLGASVEAPQSTFGGTAPKIAGTTILTGTIGYSPTALSTSTAGTAGGGLNPLQSYSYNTVPDFVVKAALEPGFGHYELFGIARFIKDEKVAIGSGSDTSKFGGGIGASAVLPVIPGRVDISGQVLAGYGIGRYGASGLPDATYKADGSPEPLPEIEALVGVTGHATPKLDLYGYVGTEQVERKYGTVGGAAFGYGNPTFDNSGCNTELSSAGCVANTKSVTGVSVGAWYKWLHGGYGTLQTGIQYSFDKRAVFDGKGGAPTVDENLVFVSLRYLPFQ
jgi:hypothetical protein